VICASRLSDDDDGKNDGLKWKLAEYRKIAHLFNVANSKQEFYAYSSQYTWFELEKVTKNSIVMSLDVISLFPFFTYYSIFK
jgi:hypothetical protein